MPFLFHLAQHFFVGIGPTPTSTCFTSSRAGPTAGDSSAYRGTGWGRGRAPPGDALPRGPTGSDSFCARRVRQLNTGASATQGSPPEPLWHSGCKTGPRVTRAEETRLSLLLLGVYATPDHGCLFGSGGSVTMAVGLFFVGELFVRGVGGADGSRGSRASGTERRPPTASERSLGMRWGAGRPGVARRSSVRRCWSGSRPRRSRPASRSGATCPTCCRRGPVGARPARAGRRAPRCSGPSSSRSSRTMPARRGATARWCATAGRAAAPARSSGSTTTAPPRTGSSGSTATC